MTWGSPKDVKAGLYPKKGSIEYHKKRKAYEQNKFREQIRSLLEGIKRQNSPTAWGYTRVSSIAQVGNFSIGEQERQILQYFDMKLKPAGVLWGGFISDPAVSGSIPFIERTGGRVLCEISMPGDHLIFAKLDRAFRNLKDQVTMIEKWIDQKIAVHMLDLSLDSSTDIGRMMYGIMGTVSEYERGRIRARVREGLSAYYASPVTDRKPKNTLFGMKRDEKNRAIIDWESLEWLEATGDKALERTVRSVVKAFDSVPHPRTGKPIQGANKWKMARKYLAYKALKNTFEGAGRSVKELTSQEIAYSLLGSVHPDVLLAAVLDRSPAPRGT